MTGIDNNLITSDFHPHSNMIHKECDKYIIYIGSLTCMLTNKNVNHTALLIYILDNEPLQKLFLQIIGVDTLHELITILANRYPQLSTSKTVFNYVKEMHGES